MSATIRVTRRAYAPLVALLVLATPLAAQSHRAALGFTGGWSHHGDLTPEMTPTVLASGWTAGLQLEQWLGSGRVGVRLAGSYAERTVDGQSGEYNVYAAGTDVLVRLLAAREGRRVAPFVALGIGATHYNGMHGTPAIGGGAYGDNPATRGAVLLGGGVDLMSSRWLGLRIEATDQVILPTVGENPYTSGMPQVHNFYVTTALQLRAGQLRDAMPVHQVVAARPAPPAPEPETQQADAATAHLDELESLADRDTRIASLEARVEWLERRVTAAEDAAAAPVAVDAAPAAMRAESHPAGAGLYTVQVGAFVETSTAERWAERLRRRSLPVWLTVVEVEGQRLTRLRVGALPSAEEARGLASALKRDFGWPTWVDAVSPDEALPVGAVPETRAFLHGG